jgi:SAM-dependent methyltransferase
VGAQSEILLRRFPSLALVGVDVNPEQVGAAARRVGPLFGNRAAFVEADAARLPFDEGTFDGAFLCWVLEHVADRRGVLAEVRRVVRPGSPVVCAEVHNATLFVHPPRPALVAYWAAFNAHQVALGGDPYVGAKLGNLLSTAGFRDVATEVRTYLLDDRAPEVRSDMFAYFADLLLSAAPGLIEAGRVAPSEAAALRAELASAATAPEAVFYYSFVRAVARA